MIALELPWPPSINNYYGRTRSGMVYIKKRGREFRAEVQTLVRKYGIGRPLQGELMAWIKLYPPRVNFDMDNLMKALWDAMEHGGVYDNDKQIGLLILENTNIKGDFVEVYIGPRREAFSSLGIGACQLCGRVLGNDTGHERGGGVDVARQDGMRRPQATPKPRSASHYAIGRDVVVRAADKSGALVSHETITRCSV